MKIALSESDFQFKNCKNEFSEMFVFIFFLTTISYLKSVTCLNRIFNLKSFFFLISKSYTLFIKFCSLNSLKNIIFEIFTMYNNSIKNHDLRCSIAKDVNFFLFIWLIWESLQMVDCYKKISTFHRIVQYCSMNHQGTNFRTK